MGTRESLMETACRLFATQGFEATTTLQIASEAGVTEPMIYYHFKGKDELYTHVLADAFDMYFKRLEEIRNAAAETAFDVIQSLIGLHLYLVDEEPHAVRLIEGSCPFRLKDPEGFCVKNSKRVETSLFGMVSRALKAGVAAGEFRRMNVTQTTNAICAMLNGILHQRAMGAASQRGALAAAAELCSFGLIATD